MLPGLEAFRFVANRYDKYLPTAMVAIKDIRAPDNSQSLVDFEKSKLISTINTIKKVGARHPLIVNTELCLIDDFDYYMCLKECGFEVAAVIQLQSVHPAAVKLLHQLFDLLALRKLDDQKIHNRLIRISVVAPELTKWRGRFFEAQAKEWLFELVSAT